jgi:hypothetical protein
MNIVFNAVDRVGHNELKDILDTNKIKYKVIDDDMFKVGFKVTKDNAQDFQMNIANLTVGRCPGSFYVEND